jgi:hypothetical protein
MTKAIVGKQNSSARPDRRSILLSGGSLLAASATASVAAPATTLAQQQMPAPPAGRPNILAERASSFSITMVSSHARQVGPRFLQVSMAFAPGSQRSDSLARQWA